MNHEPVNQRALKHKVLRDSAVNDGPKSDSMLKVKAMIHHA